MIEFPPVGWSDYELLDSGRGEKLERFGAYVLARPEPKALWDKSLTQSEWDRLTHTRFRPGAGFGKGQITTPHFAVRYNPQIIRPVLKQACYSC